MEGPSGTYNCSLCNMPINLQTAKVDDKGKAVHADCYMRVVTEKHTDTPNSQAA